MSIGCPRCRIPLDTYVRRVAEGSVSADMCLDCGGVWLDGAEVTRVYPALSEIRSARVGDTPPKRPALACPRCGDPPIAVTFFELELDHCPTCKGLWIDGDEIAELAKTMDRHEGLPAEAPSTYRESAAAALRGDTVPCKHCGLKLALEDVQPTSAGPLCGTCAAAHQEKMADADVADYVPPMKPLFELPRLEGLEVPGGLLPSLGAALKVALNAISTPCPRCGCHARSGCPHS